MSIRILVVDDDPGISEMVAIVLESEGFEVTVCANGDNVLPIFRTTHPDLVLLDVMLPGLDGVSVCAALREESDVPIVMMSAKTDSVDVISGLEAGADDYVTKPFDNSVLLARVKARLRHQKEEPEVLRIGDLTLFQTFYERLGVCFCQIDDRHYGTTTPCQYTGIVGRQKLHSTIGS